MEAVENEIGRIVVSSETPDLDDPPVKWYHGSAPQLLLLTFEQESDPL